MKPTGNNVNPKYQLQSARAAEIRQPLIDEIIKSLEADKIPWEQCWNSEVVKPFNAVTNIEYKGINHANLLLMSMMRGYTDPRFMTFEQAKKQGYRVKQGSKAIRIEYWNYYSYDKNKSMTISEWNKLNTKEKEENKDYKLRVYPSHVFNGECIDGLPPLEKNTEKENRIERLDQVVQNVAKNIGLIGGISEGYGKACYIPQHDKICMPSFNSFTDETFYYSTCLHEMAHATGHKKRLNRSILNKFGSKEYAKEELRAEISSMFLSQDLKMELDDRHMQNHKAYVQSWLELLKNEPKQFFDAVKDAQVITDYIVKNADLENVNVLQNATNKELTHQTTPKLLARF